MATLVELLGTAYQRAQVKGDRSGAVKSMQKAFAEDETLRQQAVAELDRIEGLHAPGTRFAVTVGGRTTCHLTTATRDLLKAALG